MNHEIIKESVKEILISIKNALDKYYSINTNSLKEEHYISKTLRIRDEKVGKELLGDINKKPYS
ncbi:MAG: hypothetical protein KBT36_09155 [Kurthia sp.]|nr:hypothetical protein [Candidatus Kurthia equi]